MRPNTGGGRKDRRRKDQRKKAKCGEITGRGAKLSKRGKRGQRPENGKGIIGRKATALSGRVPVVLGEMLQKENTRKRKR